MIETIGDNKNLIDYFNEIGIIKNNKEEYTNHLTFPIYDNNKAIVNVAYYNPNPLSKKKLQILNSNCIFNSSFLKNNPEIILTESPIDALLLIQNNYSKYNFRN